MNMNNSLIYISTRIYYTIDIKNNKLNPLTQHSSANV